MARAEIHLFGGPHVLVGGQSPVGLYDHVRALLAYLCAEPDRAHSRDMLAALLWPDEAEPVARRNFRQALSRLRALLGDKATERPLVVLHRGAVQLNASHDCYIDLQAFGSSRWDQLDRDEPGARQPDVLWLEDAMRVYRGPFLEHFQLPHNPDFDQWALTKREYYLRRALDYLDYLSGHYERLGNPARAVEFARRQVELEPWLESAHRRLMRLLARSGKRAAALAQYAACASVLRDELGVDPADETRHLESRIRSGELERTEGGLDRDAESRSRAEGERRQLTVLCCGLDGPGLDPEDLLPVQSWFQRRATEIVSEHGGHVEAVRYDAHVSVFGFPQAHEGDPIAAVRAAQRLAAEVRALDVDQGPTFRAGVAAGMVVVVKSGRVEAAHSLAGEPLSEAARLRFLAEGGSVLLSEAAHGLVDHAFVARPTEAGPATAYQVVRARARSLGFRDAPPRGKRMPLFGREGELAVLLDHWQAAASGAGRSVLVTGEAGFGKTRLLRAMRTRLAHRTVEVRELRCHSDRRQSALQPVLDLVVDGCGIRAQDSKAARTRKLQRAMADSGFDAPGDGALVTGLLGMGESPTGELDADPLRRRRGLDLLARMQLGSAQEHAVLWIAEDIHWADPSTLEFLTLLAERLPEMASMLVMTARPGFQIPTGFPPIAGDLVLGSLPPGETRRLVAALAGSSLPPEMLDQIVARTDGVPLFAAELTKAALEGVGALGELSRAGAAGLPRTLYDSLQARLDRLGEARAVAEQAAVIGREFDEDLLIAVSGGDGDRLRSLLGVLVRSEMVDPLGLREEGRYTFRHVLIQEAARESMLRSHRQRLHRRVADTLNSRAEAGHDIAMERIAHHYMQADAPDAAVPFWQRAGIHAAGRGAHREAVHHLRTALGLLQRTAGPQAQRREFEIQTALGRSILFSEGPVPSMQEAYLRALELAKQLPDGPGLFGPVRGIYSYFSGLGLYGEAQTLAEQLLRLAIGEGEPGMRVEADRVLGMMLLFRGRLTDAAQHLQEVLKRYDPARDLELADRYGVDPALVALALLGTLSWIRGFPDSAYQQVMQALDVARRRGHDATLAMVANIAMPLLHAREEWAQLADIGEELMRLGGRNNVPFWTAWGEIGAALSRQNGAGGTRESREALLERFAAHDQLGVGMGRAYAAMLWSQLLGAVGRHGEGLKLVDEVLESELKQGGALQEPELLRVRGELLAQLGRSRYAEAAQAFETGYRRAEELGAWWYGLRCLIAGTRFERLSGMGACCRERLERCVEQFVEGRHTPEIKEARTLLDVTADG